MALQVVYNGTKNPLWFINQETSGNNRVIPPGQAVSVGGAWIPWCWTESQFLHHHFQILDTAQDRVLWYVWQRDNAIRASEKGFEDPGNAIQGDAGTGGNRSITVNAEGKLNCYPSQ